MGWMLRHPAVVAVEVGWRWLFGIPFLLACSSRLHHVLAVQTPDAAGLTSIDSQNPWAAAAQLSRAWWQYQPLVVHELRSLLPIAALAWILISAMSVGMGTALFALLLTGLMGYYNYDACDYIERRLT